MGISRAQRRTQTNKKTTIPPQNKKKLHYHSHATKNLHCSIYSSKHKWRKTKPKKNPPNSKQPGEWWFMSTFFPYTSVPGQAFKTPNFETILLQLPTPSQWTYILLYDCNYIPSSLAWTEGEYFPLLPTNPRIHPCLCRDNRSGRQDVALGLECGTNKPFFSKHEHTLLTDPTGKPI